PQCIGDRALYGIRPLPTRLYDDIAEIVHGVGIVTAAAQHLVGTTGAIELIISTQTRQYIAGRIARQLIVQLIAGTTQGRGASERKVFDCVRQNERNRAANAIYALTIQLDDQITWIVDNISIVACSAFQTIRPACSIQDIIA